MAQPRFGVHIDLFGALNEREECRLLEATHISGRLSRFMVVQKTPNNIREHMKIHVTKGSGPITRQH